MEVKRSPVNPIMSVCVLTRPVHTVHHAHPVRDMPGFTAKVTTPVLSFPNTVEISFKVAKPTRIMHYYIL